MAKGTLEQECKEINSSSTSMLAQADMKLQKFMKEDSRLVKGIFRSVKNPGALEIITYKKYATPAERQKKGLSGGVEKFCKCMKDGEVYEIPLYVAHFLNGIDKTAEHCNGRTNSCSYPIHEFLAPGGEVRQPKFDESGRIIPINTSTRHERRFAFESLEFGM